MTRRQLTIFDALPRVGQSCSVNGQRGSVYFVDRRYIWVAIGNVARPYDWDEVDYGQN